MKFVANLSLLFTDKPFQMRFEAARAAGFDCVEFVFQPQLSGADVAALLREHGLTQILAGLPGSPEDKGLAAAHGQQNLFRERFIRGLSCAVAANVPLLHVTTGVVGDSDLVTAGATFAENMRWAAGMAATQNVCLVLEAINQRDVPGYFLRSLADTIGWLERLNLPNVRLLLDLYHAATEGIYLPGAVDIGLPWARHVQVADVHRRGEPVIAGEMALAFQRIQSQRPGATIGCEYIPVGDSVAGLVWIDELKKLPSPNLPR
ncbi:MAG: TIM barrel protein [Pseudomonadota bacterium]